MRLCIKGGAIEEIVTTALILTRQDKCLRAPDLSNTNFKWYVFKYYEITFCHFDDDEFRFSFQASNDIKTEDLTISEPVKYEVAADYPPYFRQYIRHKGGKLLLHTTKFHAQDIVVRENGRSFSVLVPVQAWMRKQLHLIEQFSCQNVSIPMSVTNANKQTGRLYRPLYQQGNMFVTISHWCNILRLNPETGSYDSVTLADVKGKGVYSMVIEVPYIYIGKHKMGESYSVTLRVVELWFEPDMTASQAQVVPQLPQQPSQIIQGENNGRKRQPPNMRPLMQNVHST